MEGDLVGCPEAVLDDGSEMDLEYRFEEKFLWF
jgi:hypothetical protein